MYRPPIVGRTPHLTIRVTPEEKASWEKAAANAGVSLSEFVRAAAHAVSARGAAIPPSLPIAKRGGRQQTAVDHPPAEPSSKTARPPRPSKRSSSEPCPHRVAPGTFCKKCAE